MVDNSSGLQGDQVMGLVLAGVRTVEAKDGGVAASIWVTNLIGITYLQRSRQNTSGAANTLSSQLA